MFVARERELAQLHTILGRAVAGQGQVAFVTGEAGSGKTALVTEFARRAQDAHAGLLVAIGQGDAQTGAGDPYLPFREILGLLTGDVDAKLAQGAITRENASRLSDFLRVSGQALVEYGPDLIDIFVPGSALVTRVAGRLAHRTGWLERLEELAARKAAGPGSADPSIPRQARDVAGSGQVPLIGSGQGLEQSHIFEQYTRVLQVLAAQQPLLLVLDDLQWADTASINLLFRLGRHVGDSRILILGAYRPAEVALGRGGTRHPLEKVLAEFKRYLGDIAIDLEKTEAAEGRQFVDALLDAEPNRLGGEFRQALFRHTDGHPLFTLELLRDMQERGDLVRDRDGRWVEGSVLDWDALPARVEGVIEERIGRLADDLRETLTIASVEGEEFTAQVIARLREAGERGLVRQLSRELDRQHRLVGERGSRQVGSARLHLYRFRHSLFQQHLYNDLGGIERELLHGDVGAVLEELYGAQAHEIAPQLAWHFAEAGETEKAIDYLLQAGDRARSLYAHQEAIDHYQRALGFLKEQGAHGRAARTLMKLGLTYHTAFDFERAHRAYEEGFALWQRTEQDQPAVPPAAPHALRLFGKAPLTLDPTLVGDVGSSVMADQLFSGLVEQQPDLVVVPAVASNWQVLDGGRRYVFHLRNDVVWSDGTPVTAGDFEYAWKRALDPAAGSPSAKLLYDVKNASAYHRREVSDPGLVGVNARDEVTLIVELEGPTGYFLHLLACPMAYPVPRHVVETYGADWTAPNHIVTNGPFKLEARQRGESLVLTRSADFRGRFSGNVERVELSVGGSRSVALELYEAGRLDVLHLWELAPLEADRARQRHAGEYVSVPELGTEYIGFDVSQAPFDDARVRRAFAMATDRQTLADVFLRGLDAPATGGFVPPGMPGHSPGIALPYDPDQARQLLTEAGYPDGNGFPAVKLLTKLTTDARREYLEVQWQENLGVEVPWERVEYSEYHDRLGSNRPPAFCEGWVADYADPDNFLRVAVQDCCADWRDEDYDGLVERARRVTDQDERMSLYRQADRILVEAAAIIPLTYGRNHMLVKPWVTRYPTSATIGGFWKDVIIEPH